jgi:Fanconi-associated nuclease 1
MALNPRSPSKHNSMLGKWIKHPKSTNFDGHKDRPAKRRRLDDNASASPSPSKPKLKSRDREIQDSDAEDEGLVEEPTVPIKTDLESALLPVETGAEAIEEYEAFKASQEENAEDSEERFGTRKWVRGKSSIYVDAFNLALDTVLEEESHLFDEAEMDVFRQWRELTYEAQYLYDRYYFNTSQWHVANLFAITDMYASSSARPPRGTA